MPKLDVATIIRNWLGIVSEEGPHWGKRDFSALLSPTLAIPGVFLGAPKNEKNIKDPQFSI